MNNLNSSNSSSDVRSISERNGSDWARDLGRNERQLARTLCVEEIDASSPAELAYAALVEGRVLGKTTVLYRTARENDPVPGMLNLTRFRAQGAPVDVFFYAGAMDHALHGAFTNASPEAQNRLRSTFTSQIERTLEAHVVRFYQGSWAKAVLGRTLSAEQYVATLQNMHQYVRFTTRLLGRAVAFSKTTALRAHFAGHLRGEINHEILLERDLAQLGASNDYLLDVRYPNAATRSFMVLQQSLVAFEEDPVLFAACPLAAEAITARMDAAFLQALRDNVAAYGVDNVAKATVFFSSHIETDGGDDGHWAMTMRILEKNLESEIRLGEFLTLIELAADSFTNAFNANVDELQLFSAS